VTKTCYPVTMSGRQDEITVGKRLKEMGLDDDPFATAARAGNWWSFEAWGVTLYSYNFAWRRKALAFHDLHHVVTGYPCNMEGEMQVATWEFAAGPCPSPFAQLFCLPLVAMGAATMPRKTFAAYRNGRRSNSLFGRELGSGVSAMPVPELRQKTEALVRSKSLAGDLAGFIALVSASALMYVLPAIAALALARRFLS
jgi:hypothetical protein